jgi:SNF2 family DNA or RNA helicase
VVGNWAAEAARFTPGLRVVVHHGASRRRPRSSRPRSRADVVITTYGTAVRDVDALAERRPGTGRARRGPGHQEPGQRDRPAAAPHPGPHPLALTGTPIENGLGDLWAILDFTNPGPGRPRPAFIAQLSAGGRARGAEQRCGPSTASSCSAAPRAEPEVAAELPDRIDELDHCTMTPEQIGLYQAVLDGWSQTRRRGREREPKGAILAAITALKQICNHPAAYQDDDGRAARRPLRASWPASRRSSSRCSRPASGC